jgi:hypothetical protein
MRSAPAPVTTAAAAAAVIGSVEEPVSARLPPFVVVPSSPVDDGPPVEPAEPSVELLPGPQSFHRARISRRLP